METDTVVNAKYQEFVTNMQKLFEPNTPAKRLSDVLLSHPNVQRNIEPDHLPCPSVFILAGYDRQVIIPYLSNDKGDRPVIVTNPRISNIGTIEAPCGWKKTIHKLLRDLNEEWLSRYDIFPDNNDGYASLKTTSPVLLAYKGFVKQTESMFVPDTPEAKLNNVLLTDRSVSREFGRMSFSGGIKDQVIIAVDGLKIFIGYSESSKPYTTTVMKAKTDQRLLPEPCIWEQMVKELLRCLTPEWLVRYNIFPEHQMSYTPLKITGPSVLAPRRTYWKFGRYTVSQDPNTVYLNDVDVETMNYNDLVALTRTALSRSCHPGIQILMAKVKDIIHQRQLLDFTEHDLEEMLSVIEPTIRNPS